MYVKAPEKAVDLFSFMSPLSANVWILMMLAGIAVSIVMFFIARFNICWCISTTNNIHMIYLLFFRFSPYETLDLDSDEGVTPFASVHHCLWFSIASWVQQGCDFLPR